ncbi:peptidylprolyl isomerase [candidate division KSB1 bacterium]|nr:peptidylprolyl isomerase [candidate division KSB1 bacterium]
MLATIGFRNITADDFIIRFQSLQKKMGLPDNGQTRIEILQTMIDEELFIQQAIKSGYDKDVLGRFEHERIQTQVLLNAYYSQKLKSRQYDISDTELKKLYIRFNTKIKARHLYADTKRQADSLYTLLKKGKTFEELALLTFQDPRLRDTGGSLGYFTADEMDPAFEDTAFALKIGQISRPVRTAQGYSIIQVQDRETQPMLTESEYAKHRPELSQYLRQRKMLRATQFYVDSLQQQLNIVFNEPVLEKYYKALADTGTGSILPEETDLQKFDLNKTEELVRSGLGVWNLSTVQEYARYTSDDQKKWIRNIDTLKEFITGLLVRSFMLSQAKKSGLHKTPVFKKQVRQLMDNYLLERMNQVVLESTKIPQDTLEHYYRQSTSFKGQEDVSEQMGGFEQARAEIEQKLLPLWRKKTKQDMLSTIRRKINVVTYPARLRFLQMTRKEIKGNS